MVSLLRLIINNPSILWKNIEETIRLNYKKKKTFAMWYGKRKEVGNWFYLYCLYSSLVVDFALLFWRNNEKVKDMKIQASYSNGISYYFPLMTARNSGLLSHKKNYLADFETFYDWTIHFGKNDVVIDIGAHIGSFSIPLFIDNPDMRFFAFEPDPYNYSCLRANLEANNIDKVRFSAFPLAVYNVATELLFSSGGHSTVGSISDVGFFLKGEKDKQFSVETTTLSAIFAGNCIERCKVLKMDCEGAEYAIFKNLPNDILNKIEILFLELHPAEGCDPNALREDLKSKGFDVRGQFVQGRVGGCWELFCVNEAYVPMPCADSAAPPKND
jgi:FkbM family methyltransferase